MRTLNDIIITCGQVNTPSPMDSAEIFGITKSIIDHIAGFVETHSPDIYEKPIEEVLRNAREDALFTFENILDEVSWYIGGENE